MSSKAQKVLDSLADRAHSLGRRRKRHHLGTGLAALREALEKGNDRELLSPEEWTEFFRGLSDEDLAEAGALLGLESFGDALSAARPSPATSPALDVQPPERVGVAEPEPKPQIESCVPISGEAALVNAVEKISEERAGADEVEVIVLRRLPGEGPVVVPGAPLSVTEQEWGDWHPWDGRIGW